MTDYSPLERSLAQLIKILQAITGNEERRRSALAAADLEAAERIQQKSDELFARAQQAGAEVARLRAVTDADVLTAPQRDRLSRLYERQQQAAATALETNTANQKLLHDLLAKVEQQMAVVRQARKALHGYGHGVGAGKKTRKILSGEL